MTETLENGYSYESTQQELSNEYQHDRVWMLFTNRCILVLWTKVADSIGRVKLSHYCRVNFTNNSKCKRPGSLGGEVEVLGEHGHNGWDLFFPGHVVRCCIGLKVVGDYFVDTRHHPQDVILRVLAVLLQHLAQGLDEPGTLCRVTPGEKA